MQCDVIQDANVMCNIYNETSIVVGVEIYDISNSTISKCGREDWDIVFPAPVVDTIFVFNFLTHAIDDHAGCENGSLFFLLLMQLFNDGHHECLKFAVVHIRDDQVANAVQSLHAELLSILLIEVTNVVRGEALHEVFFDATACCYNAVDHLVLA